MIKTPKSFNLAVALLSVSVFPMFLTSCNSDGVITPEEPTVCPVEGGFRPPTETSKAAVNKVYDWKPAPGQFVNDPTGGTSWGGMGGEEACKWAENRLDKRFTVTLGAFGGYLVAGFDHSIACTSGDYEIGIFGNAFLSASGSSCEPGIVYVMQDSNGNGLPDDTWYELKGSDTFAEGTIANYSVTYYRPSGPQQPVRWTDNLGNSGEVAYMGAFHTQPYYYPTWVKEDSYTLSGTCLAAKTFLNTETGNWENPPFGWGYVDNIGEDNIVYDGMPNCNRFRISDAIDSNGNSVNLPYIDFVKVQTGVSSSSGWLGEVSTEVLGIIDLTL